MRKVFLSGWKKKEQDRMKSKEGRKKKITPGNERGEREARPIISWNKKKRDPYLYVIARQQQQPHHMARDTSAPSQFSSLFSLWVIFCCVSFPPPSKKKKKYNNCISYIEKCVSSFILYVYRLRKSLWGMSILLASVLYVSSSSIFFFGHPPYWLRCALSGNELNS